MENLDTNTIAWTVWIIWMGFVLLFAGFSIRRLRRCWVERRSRPKR